MSLSFMATNKDIPEIPLSALAKFDAEIARDRKFNLLIGPGLKSTKVAPKLINRKKRGDRTDPSTRMTNC
jgi:hypothetical protein